MRGMFLVSKITETRLEFLFEFREGWGVRTLGRLRYSAGGQLGRTSVRVNFVFQS